MLKIGLTGGIGSGKTVVSNAFKAHGVPIIDTDMIAREVLENNKELINRLVNTFGQTIIDKQHHLIRSKLRDIAFNSEENKKKLDAIMHPAIRQSTLEQINYHEQQNAPYCIIVVPLLIETGFIQLVDRVLVVTAPIENRLQWLETRSQLSASEASKIMATQTTDEEKLAAADDHINNESDLSAAQSKVAKLHQYYSNLAS